MAKTVLITGCSTGFGKLAANTFAEKGWNVVATMRTPEKETDLATSDTMLVTRLDVCAPASIAAATEAGRAKFGGLDVVVNNAGHGANAMFEQTTDAIARSIYETNVFGVMNVMRDVLPHMREQGHGTIINVTSMAGHLGLPVNGVYASSKFAVEGLTESMALEYRDLGITFRTVAPGAFPTTAFIDNINRQIEAGDSQLNEHAVKLLHHFAGIALEGPPQDPQLVADIIYNCATETDRPIHNPVGADAERLFQLLFAGEDRQAFFDAFASEVLPPAS